MQNKKFISLTVVILTLNSFAIAHSRPASIVTHHESPKVELHDGSLQLEISDFSILRRTYNSRLNYFGYFGFGWCSDLEWHVSENLGRAEIQHCGETFSGKISGMSTIEFSSSLTSILGASRLILQRKKESWLLTLLPKGSTTLRSKTEIEFDSLGRPARVAARGAFPLTLSWNSRGTLEAIKVRRQFSVMLFRNFNEEIISRIKLCTLVNQSENCRRQKIFYYDSSKLIKTEELQTTSLNPQQLNFSAANSEENFQYDQDDNMMSFTARQNHEEQSTGNNRDQSSRNSLFFAKISYDSEMDAVTDVTTSDGCRSQYRYHKTHKQDQVIFTNEAIQSCSGIPITARNTVGQIGRLVANHSDSDFGPSLDNHGGLPRMLSLRSVFRQLASGKLSFLSESTTQTRSNLNANAKKATLRNFSLRAHALQSDD